MKRILLIICILGASMVCNAQIRPIPEEKMNDVVAMLELDQKTGDRFIKEYASFRQEVEAIYKNATPHKETEDEDEIDREIMQNFENSEQLIQIRMMYYEVFKEFMKPSQIQKVYRMESPFGFRSHNGQGVPGRGNGQGGPGRNNGQGMQGHQGGPGRGNGQGMQGRQGGQGMHGRQEISERQ